MKRGHPRVWYRVNVNNYPTYLVVSEAMSQRIQPFLTKERTILVIRNTIQLKEAGHDEPEKAVPREEREAPDTPKTNVPPGGPDT